MDYQRIYENFIVSRRAREAEVTGSGAYVERHHILPRCKGGGDEPSNLVALTADDHYFAHLLLAKVHGGVLWYPFLFMERTVTKRGLRGKDARQAYRWVRERVADEKRDMGDRFADDPTRIARHREWVETSGREFMSNRTRDMWKDADRKEGMIAKLKGRWSSEESRDTQRQAMLEMWKDPEYVEKRRVAHLAGVRTEENREFQRVSTSLQWQREEYRTKQVKERRGRAEDPAWVDKMREVNAEINGRPEVKAKHSASSKQMWSDPRYRERHRASMTAANRRKQPELSWAHKDGRVRRAKKMDMMSEFGGGNQSWAEVIRGKKNSIFGWSVVRESDE